jgi:hypothetical protein
MSDSASEEIVKPVTETVTDAKGRVIVVRRMNALDRLRVFELIGGENAANEAYLGYSNLAFSVESIDGNPLATPRLKMALEGSVKKLDDHGLAAVAKAFVKLYSETEEETKDAIKN